MQIPRRWRAAVAAMAALAVLWGQQREGTPAPEGLEWEAAWRLGIQAQFRGQYMEALEHFRAAEQRAGSGLGGELRRASAWHGIGSAHHSLGDTAAAERLYERARETWERLGGPAGSAAATLNNLGTLRLEQKRIPEAEVLLWRALQLHRTLFGDHHPRTASTLHHLATVYLSRGELARAEPLLTKARQILEPIAEPELAQVLVSIAFLRASEQRYSLAEESLRQAVAILEQCYGPQHVEVALARANLAIVLLKQGRRERGEALLARALQDGNHHPQIQALIASYRGPAKRRR